MNDHALYKHVATTVFPEEFFVVKVDPHNFFRSVFTKFETSSLPSLGQELQPIQCQK